MKSEESQSLSPIHLTDTALTKREAGGWLGAGVGLEHTHKKTDCTVRS